MRSTCCSRCWRNSRASCSALRVMATKCCVSPLSLCVCVCGVCCACAGTCSCGCTCNCTCTCSCSCSCGCDCTCTCACACACDWRERRRTCWRLVENSGWPRPIRALNARGAMPSHSASSEPGFEW
jgi:hypothetical protein